MQNKVRSVRLQIIVFNLCNLDIGDFVFYLILCPKWLRQVIGTFNESVSLKQFTLCLKMGR